MSRTALEIDDALLAQAREATGIETKSELVREGLRALIRRAASRRLARLEGAYPEVVAPPRRRPTDPSGP